MFTLREQIGFEIITKRTLTTASQRSQS